MERQEIFEKLNEIFTDVLDLDECNLTDETSANDIEEWGVGLLEPYPTDCCYREGIQDQVHFA